MPMAKALRKLVVWSIAVLVCVSLAGMIYQYWPKQFARESWRSGADIVRGSIVKDLTDRQLLLGKSRPEVRLLLGEPDFCFVDIHTVACADRSVTEFDYKFTAPKCHLIWGCKMEVHFGTPSSVVDSVTINAD